MKDETDVIKSLDRQHMLEIWQHAKTNDLDYLSEEEQLIGKLMLEHEEYHNQFELADALEDYHFDPESGVNPFLHITIHAIVENQLKSKQPIEAYQFYNSMRRKKVSHHETIHLIANIFAPLMFQVLKRQEPFDNELYKQLLKKYKDKKPEKIYPAIEKELDDIFK
jgi:hypothetical protein